MTIELYSIIATVVSVLLLLVDVWLLSANKKDQEKKNSQVKIWQQDANGLAMGLARIVGDVDAKRYSSVQDIANTLNAVHASAFALYQSLYEERTYTEQEYKQRQKKLEEEMMNLTRGKV